MTPERREKVFEALTHVGEEWTATRVAQGRLGLARKRRQRRAVRGAVAVAGAAALLALAVVDRPSVAPIAVAPTAPASVPTEDLADGALLLADGSSAEPLRPETAMAVEEDSSERVRVDLIDGATRFDVVPDPHRVFSVDAHGVIIEVLGTSFDVAIDERRVFVRVLRGHVRVTWRRGRRDLVKDQSGIFPIDDASWAARSDALARPGESTSMGARFDAGSGGGVPAEAAPSPAGPVAAATPAASGRAPEARPVDAPAHEDWRGLARRGQYESAYRASLEQPVGTSIEDLLLAADAARLSGHPREALPYLERAVALHGQDSRAHLAAFTLGRVRLALGDASGAARAFAEAQRLDSHGLLVEQALAREVEAWARAGREDLARTRADAYIQRFPEGRHAERVRRFGTSP